MAFVKNRYRNPERIKPPKNNAIDPVTRRNSQENSWCIIIIYFAAKSHRRWTANSQLFLSFSDAAGSSDNDSVEPRKHNGCGYC